ncbi:MAG TPA: VOC family protein [Parafilimonas sp.]|nr:VOC family protein [Parafilimonas sp.]
MPQTQDNNIQQGVPFFWVTDIEASIQYYVNGLGFAIANRWIDEGKTRWCWLQREGAALMLQELQEEMYRADMPSEKKGAGISIYFICKDALALYKEFVSKGVTVSKPFVGNGMWVTSLKDPDGYDLHFESATDVQEDTMYVEEKHS